MATYKHWLEYIDDWRDAPMAYWVHVPEGNVTSWRDAEAYNPPAPHRVPNKGYPVTCIEFDGIVLQFSSEAQLSDCIRVLSLKPLPTAKRLSAIRGSGAGPNGHWLSRLPAKLKSPKVRERLVRALIDARSTVAQ